MKLKYLVPLVIIVLPKDTKEAFQQTLCYFINMLIISLLSSVSPILTFENPIAKKIAIALAIICAFAIITMIRGELLRIHLWFVAIISIIAVMHGIATSSINRAFLGDFSIVLQIVGAVVFLLLVARFIANGITHARER